MNMSPWSATSGESALPSRTRSGMSKIPFVQRPQTSAQLLPGFAGRGTVLVAVSERLVQYGQSPQAGPVELFLLE
jgi:hypothetical protein